MAAKKTTVRATKPKTDSNTGTGNAAERAKIEADIARLRARLAAVRKKR